MNYKKLLISFFKKPVFAQIILLIALLGVASFLKLSFNFSGDSAPELATLFINFETEKRFFEGEVTDNMTVLDALNAAVSIGKIKFNYAINESSDVSVLEIDGHTNGAGNKYFVFYLNSRKIPVQDLNKKEVRGGDRIEIINE
ncbi:MAG: hypothetical protein UT29_C0001G0104 [Candidatus Yanofskybacteria bacterium GW2011_GWA1_39_13]|uniref:DUF4430 domain-containing protein n=1 Tax=Yanofskybacteria sp. (strain GW2011_GWA1_39_13) TaxID=1619019 RepID=A0A0G0MF14_YANXG|nr:MAG: hypothetical protein UT29_C0001G0104 [Candidatus Yanofskybacteria bacterium GW2011_GWA1_39_13]